MHLHGVAPRGAADVGVPEHEHVDVEPPGDEGEREEGEVNLNCLAKGGLIALNHEKDLIRTLLKKSAIFPESIPVTLSIHRLTGLTGST